ncbi:MAG: ExeA family protein [Candidatus Acidiferrales bacterium]
MASAIQARKGLIVLTGEVGTGKTTLLNRLREWLQGQRTPTAFIFNPHLEVNELFDLMFANFRIPSDSRSKGSRLAHLDQWLVDCYRMGTNAVLIIDEAQGLPLHVLEEIRTLLNEETPRDKLLQIVLSGQPEFEEKLKRPDLRQIRQRISLRCYTTPFSREETDGYIQRRLCIAGAASQTVFPPEAIDAVYLYSRGIPRVMNLLCEHALIRASEAKIQPVPVYLVDEAAAALQFDDARPVAGSQSPKALEPPLAGSADLHDSAVAEVHSAAAPGPLAAAPVARMPLDTQAKPCHDQDTILTEHVTEQLTEHLTEHLASQPREPGIRSVSHHLWAALEHKKQESVPILELQQAKVVSLPRVVAERIAKTNAVDIRARKPVRREVTPISTEAKAQRPRVLDLSRVRRFISEAREKVAALELSPAFQKNAGSLLHWLQQPLPTIKMRGRVPSQARFAEEKKRSQQAQPPITGLRADPPRAIN